MAYKGAHQNVRIRQSPTLTDIDAILALGKLAGAFGSRAGTEDRTPARLAWDYRDNGCRGWRVGEKRSVDLHGLRVGEAIARFVRFYNDCVRRGVKGPIEVVHGYGSASEGGGEIRHQLRGFLGAHEDSVAGWVAGDGIGNPGVTKVWVGKELLKDRE